MAGPVRWMTTTSSVCPETGSVRPRSWSPSGRERTRRERANRQAPKTSGARPQRRSRMRWPPHAAASMSGLAMSRGVPAPARLLATCGPVGGPCCSRARLAYLCQCRPAAGNGAGCSREAVWRRRSRFCTSSLLWLPRPGGVPCPPIPRTGPSLDMVLWPGLGSTFSSTARALAPGVAHGAAGETQHTSRRRRPRSPSATRDPAPAAVTRRRRMLLRPRRALLRPPPRSPRRLLPPRLGRPAEAGAPLRARPPPAPPLGPAEPSAPAAHLTADQESEPQ